MSTVDELLANPLAAASIDEPNMIAVGAVVIVKMVDPSDGRPVVAFSSSDELNMWEALGMVEFFRACCMSSMMEDDE
jgi:hypothetical protein